jgi:Raf kinase inhibitor-like YbhB/YbcL family protein
MISMREFSFAASILVLSAGAVLAQAPANRPPPLTLTSSAFSDGAIIPDKFTQAVGPAAVSPALNWTNVPAGTQSFTLIMHDLDTAPGHNSGDILHWMAFNIPGTVNSLPEGVPTDPSLPDGTAQPNNFGKHPGFMGPGAPPGAYHHYTFEFYALDTKLSLGPDATRTDVLAAMDGHVLGKTALVGRFHR